MSLRTLRQIFKIGIVSQNPSRDALMADKDTQISLDHDAQKLGSAIVGAFGRSLSIRALDAGSCHGCELELHALNNPYYNLEGMGLRFVASPRHADLLLVTGPVSSNMILAVQRTYEAMPGPRLVVSVGDCACTGGVFGKTYASRGKVSEVIPVDVTVNGCPPTPMQVLRGIFQAVAAQA